MTDGPQHGRWRRGQENSRAVYWQQGPGPSAEDPNIGILDSAELAQLVVDEHNATLCGGAGRHAREPAPALRAVPGDS